MVSGKTPSALERTVGDFDFLLRPHHVNSFLLHEAIPSLYYLNDGDYLSVFRRSQREFVVERMRKLNEQNKTSGLPQFSEEEINQKAEYAANTHTDEFLVYFRSILKRLHDNPNLRFKYFVDLDIICEKCELKKYCSNSTTKQYAETMTADLISMVKMPKLKHGRIYTGSDLKILVE